MNMYDNSYNPPLIYKRKEQDDIFEHAVSRKAYIAVILCWIFGILFAEIFMKGGFGLSVPLLTAGFYAMALWYFSGKQIKPAKGAYALLLPIGLLSIGYLFTDNITIYLINSMLLAALIALQLTRMSGTAVGPVFSLQSFFHTAISLLVRPVSYLDVPFEALMKNTFKGRKGSKSAMVAIGLIAAFPVAIIFIVLFSQADSAFGYFTREFFKNIDTSFGDILFDIFFGSVAALFISAWLITMRARKTPGEVNLRLNRGFNGIMITTFLAVLNLISVLFVAVQFGYLFAGAGLPDNMTWANYARSGFFELCAIVFFSVIIIVFGVAFTAKDDKDRLPKSVSTMLTLFIACNYVIVVSAIYRMIAYINVYDLSVKRFMSTWMIVVIAICLLGILIKIWKPGFNAIKYVAITVSAMTIAINAVNINSLIAEYNVNNYLSSVNTSQVRNIDIEYLGVLGPSAAKATAGLYDKYDDNSRITAALNSQKNQLDRKTWKNFCFSDITAAEVFGEYDIKGSGKM